jgi:hypothetical protein
MTVSTGSIRVKFIGLYDLKRRIAAMFVTVDLQATLKQRMLVFSSSVSALLLDMPKSDGLLFIVFKPPAKFSHCQFSQYTYIQICSHGLLYVILKSV